jgi:predicted Zn-dependent protease
VAEVDKILKYAEERGAQEAEIISERSTFKYAKFELGEPKRLAQGRITEYALRVVVDGSVGFSYFTGAWENAVKEAVSLARTGEKDERWHTFVSDKKGPSLNLFRKSVKDVSVEQVISDIRETGKAAQDEKVVASNIDCQLGYSTLEIANSSGVFKCENTSLVLLRIMCRAADTDYGMGYSYHYSLGYDIDFHNAGETAKKEALSQLGRQKTESGDKEIIFSPRVFSSLLINAAIPSFLGHNVAEGRSALNIGQEVASESLGITENPLVKNPQGRSFDDEGVPSHAVDLIKNRCVETFLYDNYYGETTSNGIRYARYRGKSLRDPPRPSATSLVVKGESYSLDTLISNVTDGLLVIDETNSHASKAQSGLFSIAVTSGFIIKNGEISAPVKSCMISGLAFEDLLPNVVGISKERQLTRSAVYPTFVETGHVLVDSLRVTA